MPKTLSETLLSVKNGSQKGIKKNFRCKKVVKTALLLLK